MALIWNLNKEFAMKSIEEILEEKKDIVISSDDNDDFLTLEDIQEYQRY